MTYWLMGLALLGMGDAAKGSPDHAEAAVEAGALATPEFEDDDIETLAFDKDRYERMTIPVTIAGTGPYRFFIDTGAQATVVTHRVTDALSLQPRGSAELVAMGSARQVELVDIDQLEFADRVFSGLRSPLLRRTHIGADGIIGLDSLQNLRVLIDFKNDRMDVMDASLSYQGDGEYDIVVRARRKLGQMIVTDAKVNGVRTSVVIDTGAQNSIGNAELMKRLRKRGDDSLRTIDVNGVAFESQFVTARRITMGGVRIHGAPIGFAQSPAFDALGLADTPALIIGMGNLRLFERVAIDFAEQKILFAMPDGPGPLTSEPGRVHSRIPR